MLFTKASEYALMSMVVIARNSSPQDVESLAGELGISKSFLAKILQGLARAGILRSFKGAKGGFALQKEASEVTVLEIVRAADANSATVFACAGDKCNCGGGEEKATLCSIWPFLHRLQVKVDDVLLGTTLADLTND